jgi:hypothetical protein
VARSADEASGNTAVEDVDGQEASMIQADVAVAIPLSAKSLNRVGRRDGVSSAVLVAEATQADGDSKTTL